MINYSNFLTIYTSYGKFDIVNKTLPSVISETQNNNAALIVFDSTNIENGRAEKWKYLQELREKNNFFLILSDNLSVGLARNTCLYLGQEMFAPSYICIMDDDHGFNSGFIKSMIDAIDTYYGKISDNGLRFGLFSGCAKHMAGKKKIMNGHLYPDKDNKTGALGGLNGCLRCSTTAHWNNILKGYELDEYLISYRQTSFIASRNYHRGFTTMIIDSGQKAFSIENEGRGGTRKKKLWHDTYTASDKRSGFLK